MAQLLESRRLWSDDKLAGEVRIGASGGMNSTDAVHYDVWDQPGLAATADGAASIGGGTPGLASETFGFDAPRFVAMGQPRPQPLGDSASLGGADQPASPTASAGLSVEFVELNAATPGMHATGGSAGADVFLLDISPPARADRWVAPGSSLPGGAAGSPPMAAAVDPAPAGMLADFGASYRGVAGGTMYPGR